jgi:hypothetical protein
MTVLPTGNKPKEPIEKEDGCFPGPVSALCIEKKILAQAGNRTTIPCYPPIG